jgi:hypothetical protein
LELLDCREPARLHLANFFRSGALPSRRISLQPEQVELNFLPLAAGHPRDALLHLKDAHANKMTSCSSWSSGALFAETLQVSHAVRLSRTGKLQTIIWV